VAPLLQQGALPALLDLTLSGTLRFSTSDYESILGCVRARNCGCMHRFFCARRLEMRVRGHLHARRRGEQGLSAGRHAFLQ
jgi:hypothetical protein